MTLLYIWLGSGIASIAILALIAYVGREEISLGDMIAGVCISLLLGPVVLAGILVSGVMKWFDSPSAQRIVWRPGQKPRK